MSEVDLSTSLQDVTLLLIAADGVMGDNETPEEALVRARRLYLAGKDAVHDGDCTMQPHTCMACFVEGHEDAARIWIEHEGLVPV